MTIDIKPKYIVIKTTNDTFILFKNEGKRFYQYTPESDDWGALHNSDWIFKRPVVHEGSSLNEVVIWIIEAAIKDRDHYQVEKWVRAL